MIIPKIKNNPRWGFVSGRISVLEAKLLPREFFLNLIDQEHLEDIVPQLQDTFLRDHISPGTVWADFSDLCDRFFHEFALSIREESPSTLPADFFLLAGDYLNLKSALTGSSEFPFYSGLLSHEKLLAVSHGDYADLPPALRESETGFAGEIGETDPAILDIILDGAYLRNLLAMARELGSELITAYIHDRVLSYLVIVFWRALWHQQPLRLYQQYLLPLGDLSHNVTDLSGMPSVESWPPLIGGILGDMLSESLELPEDEQISGFELRAANHLTRIARDGKLQTAGPERVFAFLAGLHVEVQNLKLVTNGRLNRIDKTLLRQRLRECYV